MDYTEFSYLVENVEIGGGIELIVQLLGTKWQITRGEPEVYLLLDFPIVGAVKMNRVKVSKSTYSANVSKITHCANLIITVTSQKHSNFPIASM